MSKKNRLRDLTIRAYAWDHKAGRSRTRGTWVRELLSRISNHFDRNPHAPCSPRTLGYLDGRCA